ncbi:MAG: putative porin [Bacteroidia bacterium]|nr:putative porin [Bacteroidia bacterium]
MYYPSYIPWYDPLDTAAQWNFRLSYFKPFWAWWQGLPIYETDLPPLVPASQEAYLLRTAPLLWTSRPFSRVRFDQATRRTQLLSVWHGQTFRKRGGLSLAYQRRLREGEYFGQLTDHYGAAATFYLRPKHFWLQAKAAWNQLQDGINGGVLYEDSPYTAFQKESQPVRFPQGSWRRWYRAAEVASGAAIGPFHLTGTGKIEEDRLQAYFLPARRAESPLGLDTTQVEWGALLLRHTLRASATFSKYAQLSCTWQAVRGKAFQPSVSWRATALLVEAAWQSRLLYLRLGHLRWLSYSAPEPATWLEGRLSLGPSQVGFMGLSRNLPWLFYQTAYTTHPPTNERLGTVWIAYNLTHRDSLLPPLELRLWYTRYAPLWLDWRPQSGQAVGLTLRGGLAYRFLGMATFFQLQHLSTYPMLLPAASGWVQVFLRGRLKGREPIYHVGVRLSGFSPFRPPFYEPVLGLFYTQSPTPLQPSQLWIEPFLAIFIRRVVVYLKLEHATEGLWQDGYFLTAWYPMPGRVFGFGVQWDIYD